MTSLLSHLDAAYNLARWLVCSDRDAQVVVQESFACALRNVAPAKDVEMRAWLLAIVRNAAYARLGENRPRQPAPAEGVDVEADRRPVNRALEELPVAYREVLVLREIEGLSYKDIATVAGIPAGTVMSRLARGRALLRRAPGYSRGIFALERR